MSVAPVSSADVLGPGDNTWPITIGVALPIPEPFLGELGAYRERFGDPQAHAIVAHITLLPPTQVPDEEHLAAILEHLQTRAAALEPFPLVLSGAGTFRPVSQVVFVPITEGEAQVREVESLVRSGPLHRSLNFPYHPHVTVAHDLEEEWLDQAFEAMTPYRAAFEVDRLGLFFQGSDGVWRTSVEFPLGEQVRDPKRYAVDSVTIEVIDPADFPALCGRLGELSADAAASGPGLDFRLPFSPADGAAWWQARIDDVTTGRRIVLVARDQGEVVGTVSVNPAQARNQPHRAELDKLMVSSTDRHRGVATRLMAAAATAARARGLSLLTLGCVAGGTQQDFYEALGYTAVGTIPNFSLSPTGRPQGMTTLYQQLS